MTFYIRWLFLKSNFRLNSCELSVFGEYTFPVFCLFKVHANFILAGNAQVITLPLVKEFDEGNWGCQFAEASGQNVIFWVNTSAQAPVGKYQLSVKSSGGICSDPNLKVYILFNPWCRCKYAKLFL